MIVRGELDLASAPVLERDLDQAAGTLPRRIVLDLAALDFIDATGLRVLTQAQQTADMNGHELVLTNVPAYARRLFSIAGVDARFRID